MRLPASLFVLHYPQRCDRRIRLHHQGVSAEPPGPFEDLLRELGERRQLETFPEALDLSQGT